MKTTQRSRFGFAFELYVMQIALVTAVAIAFTLVAVAAQAARVRDDNEADIRAVAHTAAVLPILIEGLASDDPTAQIQPLVVALQRASGVDYVTVVDLQNRRVAHTNPTLIGAPPATDHTGVRSGQEFVGVEVGPTGRTFRVKVPVRDQAGTIIGTLSIGIAEDRLTIDVLQRAGQLIGVAGLAVLLGSVLSWLVSRSIRRRLYDVDPRQIRTLLQTRDSMLDGVSDGFIAVDAAGVVTMANGAAERLVGVTDLTGRPARDCLPPDLVALVDGVDGTAGTPPAQLDLGGRRVVVRAWGTRLRDAPAGVAVVLQDRTELDAVLAQLDAQRVHVAAMRRETHEFDNRMHVVAGLLELGRHDDAAALLASVPSAARAGVAPELATVEAPLLAALLSSQIVVARERGIEVTIADDSVVAADFACGSDETTTVGNLVTNALESGATQVSVYLRGDADGLACRVDDDGPGVPEGLRETVLTEGFSTKIGPETGRGIGLHLVQRLVGSRNGSIDIDASPLGGAAFEVWIPATDGAVT